MNFLIKKDYQGKWCAEAMEPLKDDRQLRVTIYKDSRGYMLAHCQGVIVDEYSYTTEIFGDFSKNVRLSECKRLTSKAIEQAVLEFKENHTSSMVEQAKEFYNIEG